MSEDSVKKICFIGDDVLYWQEIKKQYHSTYGSSNKETFDFQQFTLKQENYYLVFTDLVALRPQIVFIDFTKSEEKAATLAQIISRSDVMRETLVVGLVDYLNRDKLIKMSTQSGIKITHVKGIELFDVVFDTFSIVFPQEVSDPDFARAIFATDITLFQAFRVGYISKEHIRVESDIFYHDGKKIELDVKIPDNVLPSKKFIVRSHGTEDCYFDKEYWMELDYCYVNPMAKRKQDEMLKRFNNPYKSIEDEINEMEGAKLEKNDDAVSAALVIGDDEEEAEAGGGLLVVDDEEKLKTETEKTDSSGDEFKPSDNLISGIKGELGRWIDQQSNNNNSKSIRVMIIDKTLSVYRELAKKLDELDFSYRFQTNLRDPIKEIKKYRPDIIAFEWELLPDNLDSKINPLVYNNELNFRKITKPITSDYNYNPIVLVYNNKSVTSKQLQDKYEYPQIIVMPESISSKKIIETAGIIKDKNQERLLVKGRKILEKLKLEYPKSNFSNIKEEDFIEKKIFRKNGEALSTVRLSHYVKLVGLTESVVSFTSQFNFPDYSVYQLNFPVTMQITIIPAPPGSSESEMRNCYRGLIHSIGETEKKKLRQFVNFVIVKAQERLEPTKDED